MEYVKYGPTGILGQARKPFVKSKGGTTFFIIPPGPFQVSPGRLSQVSWPERRLPGDVTPARAACPGVSLYHGVSDFADQSADCSAEARRKRAHQGFRRHVPRALWTDGG